MRPHFQLDEISVSLRWVIVFAESADASFEGHL